MEKFDNFKTKYYKVHFIGIGGVSMSALAVLAKYKGCIVSGSDIAVTKKTKQLKKQGIKIYFGHKKSNIKDYDLVVYTGAVSDDNQELQEVKTRNIKLLTRAEFLGEIANEYKNVIAVSGMHGKTTTTAMIATILLRCGFNPTIHIGGEFNLIKGNIKIGSDNYFLTEACEYKDSFLSLTPNVSVVTNIEAEHLDYFKNEKNINKSFNQFVNNTSDICFVNYNNAKKIKGGNIITFGINKGDIQAREVKLNSGGRYFFKVYYGDKFLCNVALRAKGKYNILNALAAIGVCNFYGINAKKVANALAIFENVERRFEIIGQYNTNTLIHDYAHHPTEIQNAIKTAKESFKKPVVCVFQPHTYSRTKTLFEKFLKCFKGVWQIHIIKTYPARETYEYDGSSEKLIGELSKIYNNVYGQYTLEEFEKTFKKLNIKASTILFLGAGSIEKLVTSLKKVLT